MIYEAKLSIPFLWDDGTDMLEMEYIPNGFNKKSYSDGVLEYKEEFRSKSEAIDFIKELLNKFSKLLKDNKKIIIEHYTPSRGINELIFHLDLWKERKNRYHHSENFCIIPCDEWHDHLVGKIEITEKHFSYDFSLLLTEEEYNLVNSDIRFKVTCGEIKEAILNCYRKKKE